ncbi:response regulator transcription factor [Ancylobacter sonchi]|uniref:response regulator transcription factor n=1 Tax=Ancylobacter sonchi TaxID=1937790 RepID=UPI001BD2B3D0|nr:response regulator transcription factor [Ancylobacter sonchi]MBS7535010.1 response regulator transcription factor [Ancylobacter sonchi]
MDTEDAVEHSASFAERRSAALAFGHDEHHEPQSFQIRRNEDTRRHNFVALIEPRLLYAQSLVKSLRMEDSSCDFYSYLDFPEWTVSGDSENTSLIILSMPRVAGKKIGMEQLRSYVAELQARHPSISFAVLCDDDAAKSVAEAVQVGVQGYLPTSLSLRLTIQILHLLLAGGTYVPSSGFLNSEPNSFGRPDYPIGSYGAFGSHKQMMVARALRSGAPNKIIAYQLNMCESTVKVHIRNIMKKLNVKNRTEAALLVKRMLPVEGE